MQLFYVVALGLFDILTSCKMPTSAPASATKDLVTSGADGNYFRYWAEGAGTDAKIFRAACPDRNTLSAATCTLNSQSMSQNDFTNKLNKFLYTDNIPYLKTSLDILNKQLNDPKLPATLKPDVIAGRDQYSDALAYANALATHSGAVTDLIRSSKLTVHTPNTNDSELENYRKPEYFLGNVFQSLGSSGPAVKPGDIRMYDWTHVGGGLSVNLVSEIASPLSGGENSKTPYRCIAAGQMTDYSTLDAQPIFKDGSAPTCCVLAPDSGWKVPAGSYVIAVDSSKACANEKRCVTLRFKTPNTAPALTCNFGVDRDYATVGLLQTVLGPLANGTSASI